MPDDHPVRALGRRLDTARRQRGWTFREFAKHTGMSKSTLQYLIGSRRTAPDYHELVALVGKLGEPWTDEWERLWRRAVEEPPPEVVQRPAVPAQLPADVPGFIGRVAELAELDRVRRAGTAIALLCGTAGVGKTALAVCWARRARGDFPDGQLYVDLRGYDPDPPITAGDALAGFLRALGVDGPAIPPAVDDRAALFRTLVDARRLLLLVDNASSVDHVRPLIPGSSSSFVVVTSRDRLGGLVAREGAHRIEVHPLLPDDATALLATLVGARVTADPGAAAALAEQCARLPLALRVAAEFAAARPGTPLAGLVRQLGDEQRRLDVLDTGSDRRTVVRGVLSWSYQHLPPGVARAFRLLGLHCGGTFGLGAAAALTGVDPGSARGLLDKLCQAYLVHTGEADRYQMHDLLRAYAAELAGTVESGAQRHAAIRRMLDYYLHSAYAANQRMEPNRLPITVPAARSMVCPQRFASADAALAWFTAEHPALLAAVGKAMASGLNGHTWRLAWTLVTFFERRGHWGDYLDTQHAALASAQRLGDQQAQAHANRCLARVYGWLGRHDDAYSHLLRALQLFQLAGDVGGQARTYLNLSVAAERRGQLAEAMGHDRNAFELFVSAGDGYGQGLALNQIGCDYLALDDPTQALVHCGRALAVFQEFDDASSQAAAWDSLAAAHLAFRQSDRAVECYQRAVELYCGLGSRYQEADTLIRLARAYQTCGQYAAARPHWQRALQILDELGHARAAEVRGELAGRCTGAAP